MQAASGREYLLVGEAEILGGAGREAFSISRGRHESVMDFVQVIRSSCRAYDRLPASLFMCTF